MKRWRLLFQYALLTSTDIFWYLLLVLGLPLVILATMGLYHLWSNGKLLWFILFWMAATMAFAVVLHLSKLFNKRHNSVKTLGNIVPRLTERKEWNTLDRTAWKQAREYIDIQLAANPSWEALKSIAIEQQSIVASVYFPDKAHGQYNFTLPELLVMLEVTSNRYREFIKDNLPYADRLSVASFLSAYAWRPRVEKGYRVFSIARRALRLSNPVSAVAGEMRDFISGKVLDRGSLQLQFSLKQVLLEELAQVAIDLYSGRLRVTDEELSTYISKTARQDAKRQSIPVEQLRVVVLGQTGAGKSTLINALTGTQTSEVDIIPTTSQLSTHQLSLTESLTLNLIDTPGIDGEQETTVLILEEASNADVLLWVCKATQPGRAPDQLLLDAIQQSFSQNVQRVAIPMAVVMTHSDRLRPIGEWESESINAAERSIIEALQLEATVVILPVGLSASVQDGAEGNSRIEAIRLWLASVTDKATNAQLNRRRLELGNEKSGARNQFKKIAQLAMIVAGRIKARKD